VSFWPTLNTIVTALPTRRFGTRPLIAVVAASFLVCYFGTLRSLIAQWSSNEMYAHGFLIPFISLYMLRDRHDRIAATPVRPDVVGGCLVLAFGLMALVLGDVGSMTALEQLSLLISVTGVVLLLFGRAMLRQVWFPIAYLLFMIPVWEVATGPLQPPFQHVSATLGAEFLRLAGVPVRLDGLFLELPNVTLKVAEACSGVNFLVAILAIGIPQAYLLLRRQGDRVFVILFAVITALITNALRVAVIGVLAYHGLAGPEIHGPGHALQGMSVAVVGFVAVFAVVQLLARRARRRNTATSIPAAAVAIPTVPADTSVSRLALIVSAVFLAVASLHAFRPQHPVDSRISVFTFPTDVGSWHAGAAISPPPLLGHAGADEEMSRTYSAPSGRAVQLYVGYFRYQVQAKELVNEHMSELHRTASPIRLTLADGSTREANEVMRTTWNRQQYILFWYEINGRSVISRYRAKAWTIWDSLSRGRTNGALIMLLTDVPSGTSTHDVAIETRSFARVVATTLGPFLPR
jgi:EpsI family protein